MPTPRRRLQPRFADFPHLRNKKRLPEALAPRPLPVQVDTHFVLTQTAEGLGNATLQAEWLQLLAGKLFGKRLDSLGETPLGPRQVIRMVTAMDELIAAAMFACVAKGSGFPMVADLDGMRYSGRRTYEKGNGVVPAVSFGDLRWQPSPNTPHLVWRPFAEPTKLPPRERNAHAILNINGSLSIVSGASVASMGAIVGDVKTLRHHLAEAESQGFDGPDGDLFRIMDMPEPLVDGGVATNVDWVRIRPRPQQVAVGVSEEGVAQRRQQRWQRRTTKTT